MLIVNDADRHLPASKATNDPQTLVVAADDDTADLVFRNCLANGHESPSLPT